MNEIKLLIFLFTNKNYIYYYFYIFYLEYFFKIIIYIFKTDILKFKLLYFINNHIPIDTIMYTR